MSFRILCFLVLHFKMSFRMLRFLKFLVLHNENVVPDRLIKNNMENNINQTVEVVDRESQLRQVVIV
jgi:hypothetical protein